MIHVPTSSAKAKLAAVPGILFGYFLGFTPMVQTLVVLILLDFASGFICAWSTKSISSDASYRGMGKKAMMLILVGASHFYGRANDFGFDMSALVAGFFCATEFISISENAARIGLPIPRPMREVIAKLNEQVSEGEQKK